MEVRLISKEPAVTVNPVVLITGDGSPLRDDMKRFEDLGVPHDVFAIGRSYKLSTALNHWGNVDSDGSIWWAQHLPVKWVSGPQTHTLGEMRGFTHWWDIPQCDYGMDEIMWHGSTALFCVYAALEMGYERVVLAGCPMDASGHWYEPGSSGPRWTGESYQAWLDFKASSESGRVRSMSGYTQIILGAPSKAWVLSPQK